jgi:hypothetical protein
MGNPMISYLLLKHDRVCGIQGNPHTLPPFKKRKRKNESLANNALFLGHKLKFQKKIIFACVLKNYHIIRN